MNPLKKLEEFEINVVHDFLWENYYRLNIQLQEPKKRMWSEYIKDENGIKKFLISNWFRNIVVLDNYEMAIKRLQELFVVVDYFRNNIYFERKDKELPEGYKNKFMYSIGIDSIRSSLDIFSKSIAWFFDLSEKEEIGFCWEKLIKPLKEINKNIGDMLNNIYKSEDFIFIKEFRDTEKHSGFGNNIYSYKVENTKFKMVIKRSKSPDFNKIESSLCAVINMFLDSVEKITDILITYGLFYKSKNDIYGKIENDGTIIIIPRNA